MYNLLPEISNLPQQQRLDLRRKRGHYQQRVGVAFDGSDGIFRDGGDLEKIGVGEVFGKTIDSIADVGVVQLLKGRIDPAVVGILKKEQESGKKEGEVGARKVFGVLLARDDGFMKSVWGEHSAQVVERLVAQKYGCCFRWIFAPVVEKLPGQSEVASRKADDKAQLRIYNFRAIRFQPKSQLMGGHPRKPDSLAAGTNGWQQCFRP